MPPAARRTVFITDNGSTPFVVRLPFIGNVSTRPGVAHILDRCNDEDIMEEWTDIERTDPKFMDVFVPWKALAFIKAWVGLDPVESNTVKKGFFGRLFNGDSWWHGGNTMLLQTGARTLMHVGDCIFKFQIQPNDEVLRFVSRMGNNDVPYPYIVGRANTYLLVSFNKAPICIPNQLLDMTKDPYDQFYTMDLETGKPLSDAKERNKINDRFEKKHTVQGFKMLHKRDEMSKRKCH